MATDKKKYELTKTEQREKKDKEDYIKLFSDLGTEEAAKKYIKENIYERAMKKGLIAAYVEVFRKGQDNSWLNKCFTAKQKKIVVVDSDGNVVFNAKTGKPKTKFVKDSRSTEKSYNKAAATKAFKDACGIEFKPTGFTARERRTEAYYNPFEGLM